MTLSIILLWQTVSYGIGIIFKVTKPQSPSNSPDSNSIEMMFADLKFFIDKQMCSNLDEIRVAIELYQKNLTNDKIASFLNRQNRHLN